MKPAHVPFERLSAFVDGELDPAEEPGVRAHLASCVGCSNEIARLEGVVHILEDLSVPDCAASAELISAHVDGEIAPLGAAVAERHLRGCEACRAEVDAWSGLDGCLRALPSLLPSARTDTAVARIMSGVARRSRLARTGPVALRAALAVLTATLITLVGPFEREVALLDPGESRVSVETPLFAGIQYAVLNSRTNTLYLAQPALGAVAAIDATTRAQVASIAVGGRPTALALDEAANTILVMDASLKTVTEIDGARNTVGTTTALAIEGTPTAIHVDAANGKIVVSGAAPAPSTPPPSGGPRAQAQQQGFVAVMDGGTKRLETQRPVQAAPQAVVLNAAGTRVLLVSPDATALVDAATYRTIETLPGGVAAAFSLSSDGIVILSDRGANARLSFLSAHDAASADLAGRAVAVVPLPEGDFAALLDAGAGKGKIAIVSSDAKISSSLDVPLAGRDLLYDAAARRSSVAGETVATASWPATLANAGPSPAAGVTAQGSASAAPSISDPPAAGAGPSPSPSGGANVDPSPSASPRRSPAASLPASPRASPSAVATPKEAGLLASAPWAWADTYRVSLPDGRRPVVVGGGGSRLWFVDQDNGLSSIDTASGDVLTFAQLPADARIRWVVAGPSFVHAIDTAGSRIFSLDLARERVNPPFTLGLVATAVAATTSTDDRLWLASSEATQLVSFDPRTRALDAVDIRTHRVSALFGDAGGGVWYAEEARNAVGHVEPGGRIEEAPVPHRGRATGLAGDAAGNAWLGTDAGEVISVGSGRMTSALDAAGPITAMVLQGGRTGWYLASAGRGAVYGPVGAAAGPTAAPSSLTSLSFDHIGRSWSTDGVSAAFFVTTGRTSAP